MGHHYQLFEDPFARSMSSLEPDIFSGTGVHHHLAPSTQWLGLGNHGIPKKLSIPITVSRVLKYIPEQQKQVEGLENKKEELTRASCKPGVLTMRENTAPTVSATCIDDRDIMVQVSLVSTMAGDLPMSKCINVLENEGLRLISSSTSAFQNRTFYSLHLQVHTCL
ncbi:unnamed protein product [Triticum turgidum subsp. durum]|uniref:Uncharacterized protein n=1 Tax=Triticum turgidum subsp. durum TaxID=4567 RepID=A0A9R0RYW4_TRITD|nr:unnamed protein product [Triticum turgidum subsp. durum]